MAVTVSTISAAEIAALNAGKILFVATNALRSRTRAPVWSSSGLWSNSGTTGVGSNIVDTSYPTRYLYDNGLYNYTRPSSAAVGLQTIYLLFDLVPGSDDASTIDVAWFKPDNFASLPGTITYIINVADDQDFSTNLRTLSTKNGWDTNAKMIDVRLGSSPASPARYTTVQFARLVISTSDVGGFTSGNIPQITEMVFGRRRQLARLPRMPHDPDPQESLVDWFHADEAGVVGGDVRWLDHARFPLRFRATDSSSLGIDEIATLRAWYADCVSARCFNFLYVDDPLAGGAVSGSSSVNNGDGHYVYAPSPSLLLPYIEQYESVTEGEIELVELPPPQSSES